MNRTRKLVAVAAVASLVGSSLMGCSTTVLEQRTRTITIRTQPPGATIRQVDDNSQNIIGQSPVTTQQSYSVGVRRFRTWLWVWPALTAICAAGSFAGVAGASDDEFGSQAGYAIMGISCAMAAIPLLIVNLVHQVRSGTEVSGQTASMRFDATLDGYHPATKSVAAEETAVSLKLFAIPGGAKTPSTTPPMDPRASTSAPIVAVFAVEDAAKNHDDTTLSQLTDFLASKLTEVAGYRVIPRDRLRKEMRQQKRQGYKRCFDHACQIDLGRAVSAQKSLATKLLKVGNYCAITSTLYDLKTETTESAASVRTSCGLNDLMRALGTIAEKLAASQGASGR